MNKKLKLQHALFFVLVILFSSCRKDDFKSTKDIYLVGYETNYSCYIACYWKNGKPVYLNDCKTIADATGIAVEDSNVYVSGYLTYKDLSTRAVYWKNGIMHTLPESRYGTTVATCIVVSDGDVYIGGSDYYHPCYWKNEQKFELSNRYGTVSSITISGNDVYAAGNLSKSGTTVDDPVYWKNGVKNNLMDTVYNSGRASSISVSGGDVYVAGKDRYKAVYWKNGKMFNIGKNPDLNWPISVANSILVVNNDVYIAGTEYVDEPNGQVVKYWKNGKEYSWTDPTSGSMVFATALAVDDKDVYIVGGSNMSSVNYWKNGTPVTLPSDPNSIIKDPIIVLYGIVLK